MPEIWILGSLLVLMIASNVAMAWYLCAYGERLGAMEAGLARLQDPLKARKPKRKSLPVLSRLP
jgi:hypothetical protein